ncbi:MAG: YbaB/EbfC family nucleoid-associated protein [Rhodospirillales bacterium]|nr:YbaB/EbfC family nucleoid-associated protein [Rhodospirillales bacterium]MSP79713.1 YbaB/EbfC family nucleoid-associated protein [Rhodospirillales bacterium]
MKNLGQMLKQAGELQARMQAMQEQLMLLEVTGSSGGGQVEVTMTGKGEVRRVRIAPELLAAGAAQALEDLVRVAVNDARAKADAEARARLAEITGGLPLPPGFQLPF